MTQSIPGLGSGLDSASIIQQLVAIEKNSVNLVAARKTNAETKLAAFSAIREQLNKLRTASLAVARPAAWKTLTATSSDTDIATVTAGTGTFGGAISFNVGALASAGSVRSNLTLAGTSASVAADAGILMAAGGKRLGFASFVSDDALSIGAHDIEVTQASAAAAKAGDGALAASTLIDGTNDTLNITVNGAAAVLTLAHGTYSRDQLAAAVQDAADAAGAAITVTVDGSTNALHIATAREGSAATLEVTGGNALAPLLLSTDGTPLTGTDGKVQIDDEAVQTVTSIDPGGTLVLNAAAGTITATYAGGLRTGSIHAKNVSAGDGTLGTVVSNINAASAGVTATAVLVGANTYRLQITSNTAGALNGANISDSEFGAGVGGFIELTAAADASVTIGVGPGAYTVTSETNTVSGLLPGVTVSLKSEGDVTITASRDVSALSSKIQGLVDAANAMKDVIDQVTKYDPETKKGSILTGDSAARRVIQDLSRAMTDAVPWAIPGSPGLAGVSIDRDGKYQFDSGVFTTKFNEDPEGVTKMFVQGGSGTDSSVTFTSAGDRARAGTYAVEITQAATQGSDVGLSGSWPIGAPPTVMVRVGSKQISYAVGASDTQQNVVDALNVKFADEGMEVSASISGAGIQIQTEGYGSLQTFDVAWDGTNYTTHAGLNVAGTIGGIAATGRGRQLSVPFDNVTLGGLALEITATSAGSLGTFDYQPGVGQRVVTSILDATDVLSGYITSTEKSLKSRVEFVENQVESMNRRIELFEARLKRQFATLDSVMGQLSAQGQWLSGQVASLNSGGG